MNIYLLFKSIDRLRRSASKEKERTIFLSLFVLKYTSSRWFSRFRIEIRAKFFFLLLLTLRHTCLLFKSIVYSIIHFNDYTSRCSFLFLEFQLNSDDDADDVISILFCEYMLSSIMAQQAIGHFATWICFLRFNFDFSVSSSLDQMRFDVKGEIESYFWPMYLLLIMMSISLNDRWFVQLDAFSLSLSCWWLSVEIDSDRIK